MTGVKVEEAELSQADKDRQGLLANKPPLSECLSLHDFETVAAKVCATSFRNGAALTVRNE